MSAKTSLTDRLGRRTWSGLLASVVLVMIGGAASKSLAQTALLVTEYGTGNLRAFSFSGPTGVPLSVPGSWTPIAGSSEGADGMVTDPSGRLLINRADGVIHRRSLDGTTFDVFTTVTVSQPLLDVTRTATHLFAAEYGSSTLHQISLGTGSDSALAGPAGLGRADGVRIGPDGRLYVVDSSDGQIFAYDLASSTWSPFLASTPTSGIASQMEFGPDGRVFVSRTIGSEARVYSFTLNSPGVYSSGLNPSSETLIGGMGPGTATGIRIGPDGRLYANLFDSAGAVWRSNVGITALESGPYITGLSYPGSIYFAPVPEPVGGGLLALLLGGWSVWRRRRAA
ncbi:MAG: PEP-CTERM sorting domain-containing protein [Verrucomicrobia bacterium]|nr:PEP-CTERM sorting domain-containing protein [Verrucomicrobiota bacterium]